MFAERKLGTESDGPGPDAAWAGRALRVGARGMRSRAKVPTRLVCMAELRETGVQSGIVNPNWTRGEGRGPVCGCTLAEFGKPHHGACPAAGI